MTMVATRDAVDDPVVEPGTNLLAKLAELGADVEALRGTDEWLAWLAFLRRFHRYSFGNQLLISLQCPAATRVAGYRKWGELGRHVRKGEHGIRILAPRLGRKDEVTDQRKIIGFGTVAVFDVSQTDGDPLPAAIPWPETTGDPQVDWVQLVACADRLGFTVAHPPVNVGLLEARGWLVPASRQVWIRDRIVDPALGEVVDVAVVTQITTLLHELGHGCDPELESSHDRAGAELVAESVAWAVGGAIGLDMGDEVTHYLASWGGTAVALIGLGRRITAAVQAIQDALWTDDEGEGEA